MIERLIAIIAGFLSGKKVAQTQPARLFCLIIILDLGAIVLACFENSFAYLISFIVGFLLLALGGSYGCNFALCFASAFFQFFFLIGIAICSGGSMFAGYLFLHCLSVSYPLIKAAI